MEWGHRHSDSGVWHKVRWHEKNKDKKREREIEEEGIPVGFLQFKTTKAMVTKMPLKKSVHSPSNFIMHILSRSVRQLLANFSEAEF